MRLEAYWYDDNSASRILLPLSWIFCAMTKIRRALYRFGLLRRVHAGVPVIVIGNITVGGSGKTPLVIWMVEQFRAAGKRVGVVSRGYGGGARHWPQRVGPQSDPAQVGDEPVLIARRTGVPVAVGPNRIAAVQMLLAEQPIDIIIADDGLQHYALARDVEIAVVDGRRRFGNGRCLPAGPLRERPSRLEQVDLVVENGGGGADAMRLLGDSLVNLSGGHRLPLSALRSTRVHGVAAIGDPARFFASLRAAGFDVVEHPFPDHHFFRAEDFSFAERLPVIMTEKDAVKCGFVRDPDFWFLPISAQLPDGTRARLLEFIGR